MNDNPVLLADTHLRLNISELTPVGTKLTSINATDRDIGINGKVRLMRLLQNLITLLCLVDFLFDQPWSSCLELDGSFSYWRIHRNVSKKRNEKSS